VLRRILERKWDEIMEVAENYIMRVLHYVVLFAKHNKEDGMGRACITHGEKGNAYRMVGEPEGEGPL
jgi:hypothetical protein